MKSKGLGDDIEKFTKATGIKKVVDSGSVTVDEVAALQKQIDDAITASPGARVIPLATTIQLTGFSVGI